MAKWSKQFGTRQKRAFRNKVAQRFGFDNWDLVKCCRCKKLADEEKQRVMELHHVYASCIYPDLRTVIENLIPLCNRCHDQFHKEHDRRVPGTKKKVASAERLATFLNLRANAILASVE